MAHMKTIYSTQHQRSGVCRLLRHRRPQTGLLAA